jgi:hypothetical protein
MGAEDWRLGDRRELIINDVVGEGADGTYFHFALHISNGIAGSLRVEGISDSLGQSFRPGGVFPQPLELSDIFFVTPVDRGAGFTRSDQRQTTLCEFFGTEPKASASTDWQKWLLSLDDVKIRPPVFFNFL